MACYKYNRIILDVCTVYSITALCLQEQHAAQLEAARQGGTTTDGQQSKLLRDKLAELEREIEKFRSENAALSKLRKDREEVSVLDFELEILICC